MKDSILFVEQTSFASEKEKERKIIYNDLQMELRTFNTARKREKR